VGEELQVETLDTLFNGGHGGSPLSISAPSVYVDLITAYPKNIGGTISFSDIEDVGGTYVATLTVAAGTTLTVTQPGWTGSGTNVLTKTATLSVLNADIDLLSELVLDIAAAGNDTLNITLVRSADGEAASPRNTSISAYPPLALTGTVPIDNATGVSDHADLAATFSRPIQFGTGNIVLRKNDGGFADFETFDVSTAVGGVVTGSPNGYTLTLNNDTNTISTNGQDMGDLTEFAIRIAATAIDGALLGTSDSYAGIADDTSWSWTTGIDMTIAITAMEENKVWQREAGTTSATVTFSGTSADGTPTAVQIRVLDASDDSVVVNWTTVDASPDVSTWSGTLSVPEGATAATKYYAQARDSVETTITDEDLTEWAVGVVIAAYGQSNMNFMFSTASSPAVASAGTYYFNGSSWTTVPSANGVRELCNTFVAKSDIPVGILNGSVPATPIALLAKGAANTNYSDFIQQITDSGGDVEFIIWHQGSGDAANGTAAATYQTAVETMHSDIVGDIGRTGAQCPFVLASLGIENDAIYTEPNWMLIQQGLRGAANDNADIHYSHSNEDVTLSDSVHWTAAGYGNAGKRYAQTLAFLLGDETGPAAWFVTSAQSISGTQTDVTVAHGNGSTFTPTSGITGFEIADGGAYESPSAAVLQNSTTIRLTHSDLGVDAKSLRYLWGSDAHDTSDIVYDNSSEPYPLCQIPTDLTVAAVVSADPPVVEGTIATGFNFNSSSYNAPLPASIASGELLVLGVSVHDQSSITSINTPSGWTLLADPGVVVDAEGVYTAIFYKTATGSEGSTVNVSWVGGNGRPKTWSARISGWNDIEAEQGSHASGIVDWTPPAITPSWGSNKNLYIVFGVADSNSVSGSGWISSYPSGYADNQLTEADANSDAVGLTLATREASTAQTTETPGVFSCSNAAMTAGHTFTIAIEPA